MKKVLIKIIIFITIAIISLLGFGYFYVVNFWKEMIDPEKMTILSDEIKSKDSLPDRFYEIYDSMYPNSLEENSKYRLLKNLTIGKSNYRFLPNVQLAKMNSSPRGSRQIKFYEISLSWEIENRTTQRECLNWITDRYDFLYNRIGIKKASEFYYKKNVTELNDNEIIGLFIMMTNPILYNPIRNTDRFEAKINEFKNSW